MASAAEPRAQRISAFSRAPAAYARPDWIAAVLGVPEPIAARLVAQERFSERLSSKLVTQLRLPPCNDAIGAFDLALVLLPADEVARLAAVFGAIWHVHAIRRLIARSDRTPIIDAIGIGLYQFLLGADVPEQLAETVEGLPLIEQVVRSGHILLTQWLGRLPPGYSGRVRLMLPTGFSGEAPKTPLPAAAVDIAVRLTLAWRAEQSDA